MTILQQDKASNKIILKYADYAKSFSLNLAMKLPKNIGINKYAIELIEGKQLPYKPLYSLGPVELEILKAYIKTYLKTGFIRPFKSFTGTLILFDKKPDGNFRLYVDY